MTGANHVRTSVGKMRERVLTDIANSEIGHVRSPDRQRVLLGGKLVFDVAEHSVDCLIRDLTDSCRCQWQRRVES
jgi:hypothetical protein